jgi:hypothetical protein
MLTPIGKNPEFDAAISRFEADADAFARAKARAETASSPVGRLLSRAAVAYRGAKLTDSQQHAELVAELAEYTALQQTKTGPEPEVPQA